MKYLISILLLRFCLTAYPQLNNEFKDGFIEAQSYFLFEEYEEALPIFTRLSRQNPYNYNLKYFIGRCLLNNEYKTNKAINFLEEAVEHINPKYKYESYKEIMAPYDAVFYLAEAYHKTNQLDKAKKQYKKFLNNLDELEYDKNLVVKRIASCQYAEDIMKQPVDFQPINLGEGLNTSFEESNAVISGDGKTIAFTRKLQFYDAIMVSYKTDSGWTAPLNLIPNLGVDGNITTSSLNYLGNTLYIYNVDDYDGNIYVSFKKNGEWGKLIKLNNSINTKFWESNAFETANGEVLYFASNRPDGYGGLDLYMSYRTGSTEWGPAINLGPIINTEYNEDAPVVVQNNKTLIFSSNGHQTMGDYDYFFSKLDENEIWSKPENIGYPLNTTKQEIFFSTTEDAQIGYFTLFNEDTYGLKDIYMASLNFLFTKTQKTEDNITDSTKLYIREREIFTISIKEEDNKQDDDSLISKKTTSTIDSNSIQSNIDEKINYKKALVIKENKFSIEPGSNVKIPINLSSPSTIKVSIYNKGKKIKENVIETSTNEYIYVLKPLEGHNSIVFSLLNKDGKTIERQTVEIVCQPKEEEQSIAQIKNTKEESNQDSEISHILDLFDANTGNAALKKVFFQLKSTPNISFGEILGKIYNNTAKENTDSSYTIFEVNQMFLDALGISNMNINEFYNLLLQHGTVQMRNYITGLPINQEGYTPNSLLTKIFKDEAYESYTNTDIYNSLSNILEYWLNNGKSVDKTSQYFSAKSKPVWPYILTLLLSGIILIIIITRRKKRQ